MPHIALIYYVILTNILAHKYDKTASSPVMYDHRADRYLLCPDL